MAANMGSLRQSFMERGKERLIARKYNAEVVSEGCLRRFFRAVRESFSNFWNNVTGTVVKLWEMGRSDPRKVFFAAKVGFSLCLVSLSIYFREPFTYIGQYSTWAILTVVLCFEYNIGATLNRGFNRALGSLSAGALAIGIAELAMMAGEYQEAVIVVNVFLAGFLASYIKLYPPMKQYEYGFRVFQLTFCIVLMTETSNVFETSAYRLLLIAIGAFICLTLHITICPIWAGEDLHKLVVKNLMGVARSIEGCVNMYLQCVEYSRIPSKILIYQASDDPLYEGYRAAVDSTSQEEILMEFATWEPPHGRYNMYRYPWSEFVKVSGALRHCAFMVMAMHGCILSEIQASSELRQAFKDRIHKVGIDGAKVLRLLGDKVEKMEKLSDDDLLQDVHAAAEDLQMLIDQKSYLLVHAESWDAVKQPENRADPEVEEIHKPVMIGNLGDLKSTRSTPVMTGSVSQMGSEEDLLRHQSIWPSRLNIIGDTLVNEREVRTYESASALSLATFMSLLIEFVARLQNLVDSFKELSVRAKFREPADYTGTLKIVCSTD